MGACFWNSRVLQVLVWISVLFRSNKLCPNFFPLLLVVRLVIGDLSSTGGHKKRYIQSQFKQTTSYLVSYCGTVGWAAYFESHHQQNFFVSLPVSCLCKKTSNASLKTSLLSKIEVPFGGASTFDRRNKNTNNIFFRCRASASKIGFLFWMFNWLLHWPTLDFR